VNENAKMATTASTKAMSTSAPLLPA
jgi:hypothetical protein